MESLGEKLRSARESKGYTFDHAGRETNIAQRYLEALEQENFAPFPGEAYILGFLSTYGEYLGLDGDELLSLYRALRIEEQPVPVENLLEKHTAGLPKVLAVVLIVLGAALLCAGAFFGIRHISRSGVLKQSAEENPAEERTAENRAAAEYTLETNSLERRFYAGDTVLIPAGGNTYKAGIAALGERVEISLPSGNIFLDLSAESAVDLTGDGVDDIKITLSDFIRNDPAKGGLIRFELTRPPAAESSGAVPAGAVPAASVPENAVSPAEGNAPAGAVPPGSASPAAVVFTSPSAYPFTLQATFAGYCMFRWESDRRTREEHYFHKADVQNVQAQNGIRLWVSNASAVRFQVIGGGRTVNLDIGGPGEVVVADLRWIRDDDGRFRLALVKLD